MNGATARIAIEDVRASGPGSWRSISGKVLVYLAGFALILSAAMKFGGVPPVVRQMAAAGFAGGKLTLIAWLEVVSAALFLWPRTRSGGLLLVCAYLGGAICSHVQAGDYAHALAPSLLLTLACVGTWLRHPQSLWNLDSRAD